MRLAGAMTIHQGMQPQFCELVINDLARHVDALFILENWDAPRQAIDAIARLGSKVKCLDRVEIYYTPENAITVGHELHARLFALMESAKPEMVLFPDADELLPPNVEEAAKLLEDSALCIEFPVLVCVGDAEHVIATPRMHDPYHRPQVTLCRWRAGLDFEPGFNYPAQDYVGRGIVSPWPKRHLYVATPALWRARYAFKPQPWMLAPWQVAEYDPKRTWKEWMQ